ncbi:hypothetical protein [Bacillus sp. ISL-4]|nr:hypothetical protein [Bacillus sp. ISL-4]
MVKLEMCKKCTGQGYILVKFPDIKEACYYCQGTGKEKIIN